MSDGSERLLMETSRGGLAPTPHWIMQPLAFISSSRTRQSHGSVHTFPTFTLVGILPPVALEVVAQYAANHIAELSSVPDSQVKQRQLFGLRYMGGDVLGHSVFFHAADSTVSLRFLQSSLKINTLPRNPLPAKHLSYALF